MYPTTEDEDHRNGKPKKQLGPVVIAGVGVFHWRHHPAAAPEFGSHHTTKPIGEARKTQVEDGKVSRVVNKTGRTREDPGTEIGHVQRYPGDPPGDLVPSGKVIVGAFAFIGEIHSDS